MFKIIRASFNQRRKTLANSLVGETVRHTKAEIEQTLAALGYRTDIRGEALGLVDFARISDMLTL